MKDFISKAKKMARESDEESAKIEVKRDRLQEMTKSELIDLILKQGNNKPVPASRTKKPTPAPRTKKPVPAPRTKVTKLDQALKDHAASFEVGLKNNKDPLVQLQNTRKAVAYHFEGPLKEGKGFKFDETLKVTFEKAKEDETTKRYRYEKETGKASKTGKRTKKER